MGLRRGKQRMDNALVRSASQEHHVTHKPARTKIGRASCRENSVHVIQADIYHLPLRRVFDYAFSVGVLHHLPDPRDGFVDLASKVKSGGHISAWVYGAENNEWITRWIDPLRKNITSRINPRALLQLSKLPAAILYATNKTI